jgi:hypothetical protein
VMSLAIGLSCLPRATAHPVQQAPVISTKPLDDHLWHDMDTWEPTLQISNL